MVASVVVIVAVSAGNAGAEPGTACAATYHAALSALDAARGTDVANAVASMRAAEPALPGRWLFAPASMRAPERRLANPEPRTCLEQIKIAGRLRCKRFGDPVTTAPALPTELDITPPPTPAELRVLKAVADLVAARGGVPDVGPNGRYRWLAERASADIKSYISQPPHAAICSGAKEVAEFYATALAPLQKRVASVIELAATARKLADDHLAAARGSSGGGVAEVTAPTNKPSLNDMIGDAVKGVLADTDAMAVRTEPTPVAALMRAKPLLIAAQVAALEEQSKNAVGSSAVSALATDAAPSEPTPKKEGVARTEAVLMAARAVRMLEAAAYAEIYAERYARFSAAVLAMPALIVETHKSACTCEP